MADGIYPGCVDPVKSVLAITSSDAAFDLSNVTAGRIVAVFDNDEEVSWAATLSDQTSTTLTLTRLHAATDVPDGVEGTAYLRASLDTPDSAEPLETTSRPVPVLKLGS